MNRKKPSPAQLPPPVTAAQALVNAAETAHSDRSYRRHIKAIRDQARRTAATTRLTFPNTQAVVHLHEMPDGSVAALARTHRKNRPHRASLLTGDDETMAKAILNRDQTPLQPEGKPRHRLPGTRPARLPPSPSP